MKIYDVSMLIEEGMMVYKNRVEKKPIIKLDKELLKDGINETVIKMNLHTGTHIDAPYHMQSEGETIEKIDLNNLITKCHVFDLTKIQSKIEKSDLLKLDINAGDFILFKTQNSLSNDFLTDFVYLTKDAAVYLAQKQVIGVGIDSLGIERDQPKHDTHNILFNNNIIIIEGLRLKAIAAGKYFMLALPLKIKGADGAPARIVLIKQSEFSQKFNKIIKSKN